jgi:hypothetical protein
MTVHEHLNVEHHQQDTNYYCGAASAHMVLQSIGSGHVDQDDLYNDNHGNTVEPGSWASGPDGVAWTLNHRKPANFNNGFVLYSEATEGQISRKLCWTIHHYQVAPIAFVQKGNHCVVVRGFEASAAPATYDDTGYTITAFDINNPWPPVPTGVAEPPHTTGDGCGMGGTRGTADEHIAYTTWATDYMTPNQWGTIWLGRHLAVCDPEPAPSEPGPAPRLAPRKERLITAAAARQAALKGFDRHAIRERKQWARALRGAEPGRPELVHRIDRADDYYWVVPMTRGGGVLAAVDALRGTYKQAVRHDEGTSFLLERSNVIEHVMQQRIDLDAHRGRLRFRPDGLSVARALVWKPCLESLSPFWPFYLVTMGSKRLYVRVDGAIFTKLTETAGGI